MTGPRTPARLADPIGPETRRELEALRLEGAARRVLLPDDFEERLAAALRADAAVEALSGGAAPAGLGMHARLELTLLRVEREDVARLEEAVRRDRERSAA